MALKDALQSLDKAVKDLTSLHVQTYSGLAEISKEEISGFDNLRATINPPADATQPNTKIKVSLMLETLVKFDGDSYNFVAREGVSDELFRLHKDALDSGLKTRLGLMEMMKNVFS